MNPENESSPPLQQYHLTRQLGQGSFGQVFLATDSLTQQEVAIKVETADTDHPQL